MEKDSETASLLNSQDSSTSQSNDYSHFCSEQSQSQPQLEQSGSHVSDSDVFYAQYCLRWYVLAVVCVINASNAMVGRHFVVFHNIIYYIIMKRKSNPIGKRTINR